MDRLIDWRALALMVVIVGSPPSLPQSADSLSGTWVARQIRWRAPRPLTEGAANDPRRRPSETMLVDLRLEIRQDGDSLIGLLTNARDPEDVQWRRDYTGHRVGDSVFLAATAAPGRPNSAFEGELTETEMRGRLNVPPRDDLRPGLLASRSGAAGRQALPPMPTRDEWLPVIFRRAPE